MSTLTISIPKKFFFALSDCWINAVKSVKNDFSSELVDKSLELHNSLVKNSFSKDNSDFFVAKFKSSELQEKTQRYSKYINSLPVETKNAFSPQFNSFWSNLCLYMTLEE